MQGIYLSVFCEAHRLRINIIHIIFMTTCVQNDEGNKYKCNSTYDDQGF